MGATNRIIKTRNRIIYQYSNGGVVEELELIPEYAPYLSNEDMLEKLMTDKKVVFKADGVMVTAYLDEKKFTKLGRRYPFIRYSVEGIPNASNKDLETILGLQDFIASTFSRTAITTAISDIQRELKTTYDKGLLKDKHYISKRPTIAKGDKVSAIKVGVYRAPKGTTSKDVVNNSEFLVAEFALKAVGSDGKSTVAQYKAIGLQEFRNIAADVENEVATKAEENNISAEAKVWLKNLKTEIFGEDNISSLTAAQIALKLNSVVGDRTLKGVVDRGDHKPTAKIGEIFAYKLCRTIDTAEALELYKESVYDLLRENYEYYSLKACCENIYNDVETRGLSAVVSGVDIDLALDTSTFKDAQTVLKHRKATGDGARYICMNLFKDETNLSVLRGKILNTLKIYDEITNFPKKDILSLTRFLIDNSLKDYLDKVAEFDEAVELIMDMGNQEQKETVIRKFVNNPDRDYKILHDKGYYFEKRLTVKNKDEVEVRNMIEVLADLKDLIPEFNNNSDVAVLHNIVLDKDGETLICQFYTFSTDTSGEDMDGRRLLNLARLYNRSHKVKLYFNHDDINNEDDKVTN